jgi:CheY-like chemotaxis protein
MDSAMPIALFTERILPEVGPERRHTILLIDDELTFCAVMAEILESFGHTVVQAHDARQAMGLLDCVDPDLILTDVMMPELDGLSLIRHLRNGNSHHEVPVVVISAKATPGDIDAARQAGADACLPKPFSVQELRTTLDSFLARGPQAR